MRVLLADVPNCEAREVRKARRYDLGRHPLPDHAYCTSSMYSVSLWQSLTNRSTQQNAECSAFAASTFEEALHFPELTSIADHPVLNILKQSAPMTASSEGVSSATQAVLGLFGGQLFQQTAPVLHEVSKGLVIHNLCSLQALAW